MAEKQDPYELRVAPEDVWNQVVDQLKCDEFDMPRVFVSSESEPPELKTQEQIRAFLQRMREGENTRFSSPQRPVDTREGPAVSKEPKTMIPEEDKLLEDLIEYYIAKESTMPVAPLVEYHEAELTRFYVRPLMMAYKKPNVFGQQKQSKEQKKTKISSYRELLFGDYGFYKRIYLTSDAGMGKTSFSKMLARTWCQAHKPDEVVADKFGKDDIDTLRNFDFLFMIKLREYQGENTCCLDDMIVTMLQWKLQRASSYTKPFVEQVLCKRQCLIIVDGLDEWSHPEHTPSQVLPVEVIPHTTHLSGCCSVLTTTRPRKLSDALLSKADIDRQVEISELDETTAHELKSRAIQFLIEHQEQNGQMAANSKRKTVTDFENSVPEQLHVHGHILYIPFVLLQMICLWFENSPIGKSLCEVYSNIIELTLTRWLVKTDFGHTDCKCEPSDEHENIKFKCMENNRHCQRYTSLLLKIGELAFSTLFNVVREKSLLFDKRQVRKYLSKEELEQCLDMGLLSQVKDATYLSEIRLQLYFSHKTLQEYFCALFIVTNWNKTKSGVMSIKQTISNKCTRVSDILEMSKMFVFVCGLNPEVYSDISRHLATIFSTDQSVIDYRNDVKVDSRLLQDYQHMQISCFLEGTRNQLPESKIVIEDIFVNDCAFSLELVKLMKHIQDQDDDKQSLEKILQGSVPSMKSLALFLQPAEGIVRILDDAEFPCLEYLSVIKCEPTSFQSVLTTASHTLNYLKLHEVSLTADMCRAISTMNNLRGLNLDNVDVSSDSLDALSDCISDCMSLQKLRLDFQYKPSGTDEKPEQLEASMNYLLTSVEAKKMLTFLKMHVDIGHQNCVLDLSKHDKLQELYLDLPRTELHITCYVYRRYKFSTPAVSSLLVKLRGAPMLETLAIRGIRNPPHKLYITALPQLTNFTLRSCDLRNSNVTLTLPLLTEFALGCCDLRDSTVILSPNMTSLKTIMLVRTPVKIPCCRELFLSISKLPQPITVILNWISMTVEEWRELLFNILGKLPKSIYVEMPGCKGPSKKEWRNIFDDMNKSPAFCVKHADLVWSWTDYNTAFDTVVVRGRMLNQMQ